MMHSGIGPNSAYFADAFYSENSGLVDSLYLYHNRTFLQVTDTTNGARKSVSYLYKPGNSLQVSKGSLVSTGDVLFTGNIINKVFFIDISRLLLTLLFVAIGWMVYIAYRRRKKEKRI